MVKQQMIFSFPQEHIQEPIIYNLSHEFRIVTNIIRADISEEKGWIILELEGDSKEIEQAINWVTARGVRVDPVVRDTVEDQQSLKDRE